MRVLHANALAALDSGRFTVRCLLKAFVDGDPICIWDDVGTIVYGGDTYTGAAGRFTVEAAPSEIGASVPKMDVVLSGLDSTIVNMIDGAQWHQRPIICHRLFMAVDAPAVLYGHQEFAGRMDAMTWSEAANGTSTINLSCESSSREMHRSFPRTRSDPDQRTRASNDAFLEFALAAISKSFNWGGAKQAPPKLKGIAKLIDKL